MKTTAWFAVLAYPALASKILKTLNAVKFLFKSYLFSDWQFIKCEDTVMNVTRHFLHWVLECIKHMDVDARHKVNSIEDRLQGMSR
jgi:uncharacterized protein (UPF0128 family)